MRPLTRRIWIGALGGILFTYGLGAGHYKWPPFAAIVEVQQAVTARRQDSSKRAPKDQLLAHAFTDPVIPGDLLHPPIQLLEGIRDANERIFMESEGFEFAYANVEVLSSRQLRLNNRERAVVHVQFTYRGRSYDAYSYGRLPPSCTGARTASLIIPGSGLNQSEAIAGGSSDNYHAGILDALTAGGDVFTLIKPNEDLLAWHNGEGKKLTGDYIWNYHINRSGSYSVSYLVQSMAFVQWMQSCYYETIVAGLSQGGAAALLVGLQAEPTLAIVASGVSVVAALVEKSGHDQLLGVPGYASLVDPDTLRQSLQATVTSWLFAWGCGESGVYGIDAEQRLTATAIDTLANVTTLIHEGRHEFPVSAIREFIERHHEVESSDGGAEVGP
jgi:hypothetical protein